MWKKQFSKTKVTKNHPFLVPQKNGQNTNQKVRVFSSYVPFTHKKCVVHIQTLFASICGTVSFTLILCIKVILVTTTSSISKLFTFIRTDVIIPSEKGSTTWTSFWQRMQNRMKLPSKLLYVTKDDEILNTRLLTR